jgi:hypothetical protein
MRKRILIYATVLVVIGVAIALRLIPWESLYTTSPQAYRRYQAQAAKKFKPKITEDATPDFARIDHTSGRIFLFTHHHAAYYAIKKAQLEGRLPWRGNILINFDSHDDANVPWQVPNPEDRDRATAFLKDPSLSLQVKLKRLRAFVHDDLNITAWVLPLIEDGSLSAYYYVLPHRWPLTLATSRSGVVNLKRWMAGEFVVLGPKPPRIAKGFQLDVVRAETLPSAQALAGKSVMVTFDMDYFSNADNLPMEEDYEPRLPTADQIRAEMATVVASLKARRLQPPAILICESPGFTPLKQIPLIRDTLLADLKQAGF